MSATSCYYWIPACAGMTPFIYFVAGVILSVAIDGSAIYKTCNKTPNKSGNTAGNRRVRIQRRNWRKYT